MSADPVIETLIEHLTQTPYRPTVFWGRGLHAAAHAGRALGPARVVTPDVRDLRGSRVPAAAALAPEAGSEPRFVCRLPRSREELAWMARVAAAQLPEDGELWMAGHNREGIKGAARTLAQHLQAPEAAWNKRRCRVLVSRRRPGTPPAPPALASVVRRFDVTLADDRVLSCATLPGVFSHGRLDGGSARLLEVLAALPAPRSVLDLGCGGGVLGLSTAVLARAVVTLVDSSVAATEASRLTATAAGLTPHIVLAPAEGAPAGPYDLIVTNPPFHDGREQERHHLAAFTKVAAARVSPDGGFLVVANRHLGYRDDLLAAFRDVTVVREDARFRVWQARGPR